MKFSSKFTVLAVYLSTLSVSQALARSDNPPNRVIIITARESRNESWIELTELALRGRCIWRSRICPSIAAFVSDDWAGDDLRLRGEQCPWVLVSELNG